MAAPLKQCLLGQLVGRIQQLTTRLGGLTFTHAQRGTINRAVTYCVNRNQYRVLPRARTAVVPQQATRPAGVPSTTLYNGSLARVCCLLLQPVRTKTTVSIRKGKEKTVRSVVRRFKRLEWGGWIRTKAGKSKRRWAKSLPRYLRLQRHVFCNGQQSKLLDKMVTGYWRKHRHYPEDPYTHYHKRTNLYGNDVPPFLP